MLVNVIQVINVGLRWPNLLIKAKISLIKVAQVQIDEPLDR